MYEEQGERCLIMKMMVLHTNIVGINQIQKFYISNFEQYGNALVHDKLFQNTLKMTFSSAIKNKLIISLIILDLFNYFRIIKNKLLV